MHESALAARLAPPPLQERRITALKNIARDHMPYRVGIKANLGRTCRGVLMQVSYRRQITSVEIQPEKDRTHHKKNNAASDRQNLA